MKELKQIIKEEIENLTQEINGGMVYNNIINRLEQVETIFNEIDNGIDSFRQENGYTRRKFHRLSKDAKRIRKSITNLKHIMKKTYYDL